MDGLQTKNQSKAITVSDEEKMGIKASLPSIPLDQGQAKGLKGRKRAERRLRYRLSISLAKNAYLPRYQT